MIGYTESSLREAARDGRATPDGRLPITDEIDLRRALLATGRADEALAASLITHCARRGRDLGYGPEQMQALVAASSAGKRLAGLLKRVWDPSLHPRGADGRFLEVGAQVNWSDRAGRGSIDRGGTIAAINPDGTVRVVTHQGQTRDLNPTMLRTVRVKARLQRQPRSDRAPQAPTDTAIPVGVPQQPDLPQGRYGQSDVLPGADLVGASAALSDEELAEVRAAAGIHLARLPDDPATMHQVEDILTENPQYRAYLQRQDQFFREAEELDQLSRTIIVTAEKTGVMLGSPEQLGLTREQYESLRRHYYRHFAKRLEVQTPYDDPLRPIDLYTLSSFLSSASYSARSDARAAENQAEYIRDTYEAREARTGNALRLRMDSQDMGPDASMVGFLQDLSQAGQAVDALVERVLEREGLYSDALDDETAWAEHEQRLSEITRLRHELFMKYNPEVARRVQLSRPDQPIGPVDLAKDSYSFNLPKGEQWTAEGVMAELERMWGNVPEGTRRDADRALNALNSTKPAYPKDGRRRYAARRAQVTRQVMEALGVEFGPPEDMEFPYIGMARPMGPRTAWDRSAAGRPYPGNGPGNPFKIGDEVLFGTDDKGRPVRWEVIDPGVSGHRVEIAQVGNPGRTQTVNGPALSVEIPLTPENETNLRAALERMPTAVIRDIWSDQPTIKVNQAKGGARASRAPDELNVGQSAPIETLIHEEHHGWENAAPWVRAMEWTLLADRGYEGEIGSRRPRPGKAGRPRQYRVSRLSSILRWSAYRDSEVAIEDDFTEPYMGKLYGAHAWDDRTLGGEWGAQAHYEVLTMTSESVLSGLSYQRDETMVFGVHNHLSEVDKTVEVASRDQALRQQHGWYLGMVLYATHGARTPTGGRTEPVGAPRSTGRADLGTPVNPMSTPPVPRLKTLRTTAFANRGAVDMYRKRTEDGSTEWTMVVREPGDPDGMNGSIRTTWIEAPGGTIATKGGGRQNPTRHSRSIRIAPDGSVTEIKVADLQEQVALLRRQQRLRRAAASRRAKGVPDRVNPETIEDPAMREAVESANRTETQANDARSVL